MGEAAALRAELTALLAGRREQLRVWASAHWSAVVGVEVEVNGVHLTRAVGGDVLEVLETPLRAQSAWIDGPSRTAGAQMLEASPWVHPQSGLTLQAGPIHRELSVVGWVQMVVEAGGALSALEGWVESGAWWEEASEHEIGRSASSWMLAQIIASLAQDVGVVRGGDASRIRASSLHRGALGWILSEGIELGRACVA